MASEGESSFDAQPSLIFRDSTRGKEGEDQELGRFRQLIVAVIEETNDEKTHAKVGGVKEAFLQPRNWHLSELEAFDVQLPDVKDRRLSVALVSDFEHDFNDFKLDTTSGPFYNDWDAHQKSTRIVDYADPKGKTALLAQHVKVVDDQFQQYTAALVMSTKIGDHAQAASGYVWDDNLAQSGKLATVFILNTSDQEGVGRDGHPYGLLGVRTDTHFEWTTDYPDTAGGAMHGRIKFDTMDVTDFKVPTVGDKFKTTMAFDSSAANSDSALLHETGQWRPWFRNPRIVPGGGYPFDGLITTPGDPGYPIDGGGGGGSPGGAGGALVTLPNFGWTIGDPPLAPGGTGIQSVPGGSILFSAMCFGLGTDGQGTIHVSNADGSFSRVALASEITGGGGGGAFTTGTNAGRPGTPSAVGDSWIVTDKLNGPANPSGHLDPSTAVGVGLLDGLTWGYLALINGWPQTISSNWVFSGAPTVTGSLRATGSGTIDANKLKSFVVNSPVGSTNCPLVWGGSTWTAQVLPIDGGGTNKSSWSGSNTVVYVSAANTLAETSAPGDTLGGHVLTAGVSTGIPTWLRGLQGGTRTGLNQAGSDITISGQLSTGSGVGGALLFKASPPGASSSTANTALTYLKIDGRGNVIVNATGSAIGTSATDGFFYLPSGSGTPSGTPGTIPTGAVACRYDTSADKLWVYNGAAWKSVTLT